MVNGLHEKMFCSNHILAKRYPRRLTILVSDARILSWIRKSLVERMRGKVIASGRLRQYWGLPIDTRKPDSLVITYLYLSVASIVFGLILVVVVLFACQYFGIDISQNWWIVAIPVTLSVFLNVILFELYRKYEKK